MNATPLERDIRDAINRHSAENESNTPDFVLAEYLTACLDAYNLATRKRDAWYGFRPAAGGSLPVGAEETP